MVCLCFDDYARMLSASRMTVKMGDLISCNTDELALEILNT